MKLFSYKYTQAVCTGISVVLQYLFLVTFMWMLMEGVVLYVSLVRVFVTHTKRYITAFTVASYGQLIQHQFFCHMICNAILACIPQVFH